MIIKVDFSKKGINKSILFYVVSALFLIASAIGLTTGNENTMAIIWLSLGSAFLFLGSTYKKKENNKTNKIDLFIPFFINKNLLQTIIYFNKYFLNAL